MHVPRRSSRPSSRLPNLMSGLIVPHRGFVPKVASSAFIATNATLVGDVEIGANASIWFGVILRGDGPGIRIGENSNLQDGTVVHVAARGLMTVVGRNVGRSYGALACLRGAGRRVHRHALDGARRRGGRERGHGRGRRARGPRQDRARGELWAGNPARKMRDLTEKDFADFKRVVAGYVTLSRSYVAEEETVKARKTKRSQAIQGDAGRRAPRIITRRSA